MKKQKPQNNEKIDEDKLLKGILLTLLDGKSREIKTRILKEVGFNQNEIVNLCGPAESTMRVRKLRETRKNETKE